MSFGTGAYQFNYADGWLKSPPGWVWGWIPAIACDSRDRVFVYSRSQHPLAVFDKDGNFIETWGEGVLTPNNAHGLHIDADDNVYCVDTTHHAVYKFNREGKMVMTLGTPGQKCTNDGDPFNMPTDLDIASNGDIFISDGYGNARVHRFSHNGQLKKSWGERGNGAGQFSISHSVRVDRFDRIWICDRENNRIQIFDMDGNYLEERANLLRPNTAHFDRHADVVYVAELGRRISIFTLDGRPLAQWGSPLPSEMPGEFRGGPHGLWLDSNGDLYAGEVELGIEGRMHKYLRKK
jgi:sugar lactone lactonase YvrE